jgi:hypothetical protein
MCAKSDMIMRNTEIKPAAMRSPAAPTFNSLAKEWSSVESGFCSMVLFVGMGYRILLEAGCKVLVEEPAGETF